MSKAPIAISQTPDITLPEAIFPAPAAILMYPVTGPNGRAAAKQLTHRIKNNKLI